MSSLYNCFLRPILFFLAFTHTFALREHIESSSVSGIFLKITLTCRLGQPEIKRPTFRMVDDLPCLYQEVEREFSVKN